MTLVSVAAPLVAPSDRNDRMPPAVERLLRAEPGPLVVPAPVSAEVDDLLARRASGSRPARRSSTFDERHFRALRPLDDGAFILLPGDG